MTIMYKFREKYAEQIIGDPFGRPTHIAVGDNASYPDYYLLGNLVSEIGRTEITREVDPNNSRRVVYKAIFTAGIAIGTWREIGLLAPRDGGYVLLVREVSSDGFLTKSADELAVVLIALEIE